MKNYSKRILTSVLTLVLLASVLGTGVFAWFTLNTKATATGLTGTAEAGSGGLYVKLNGAENDAWDTNVNLSTVVLENFRFTDLTTENGKDFTDIKGNPVTEGYLEFKIDFLTGSSNTNLYVSEVKITSDIFTKWKLEKDFNGAGVDYEKDQILEGELASAIRVSFGTSDTIFEAEESDYAGLQIGNTTGIGLDNFANDYYKAINGSDSLAGLTLPRDADNDKVLNMGDTAVKIGESNQSYLPAASLNLDPSFNTKGTVKVYVWIEGWDAEAFNALYNGTVNISLAFEAKQE